MVKVALSNSADMLACTSFLGACVVKFLCPEPEQLHATHFSGREVRVRDLYKRLTTTEPQPDNVYRFQNELMCSGSVQSNHILLPKPVLALLGGELIKCFGLLFPKKGLMVVLEAFIVFLGSLAQV